ncbi:MAG: hypothetical protein GFH27_549307n75 [Chloroflexi bacterium AL-W]|nr:hypothetical protein [Chloroflexi bacterium AL-N1]NOK69107.1 hypothetical protein [Chloroflexi bacterium AL-N10]NOK77090.1 hypothetical protein [Chloroflexi bacterium AL-N5]NOK83735.1 hypothetical protein [Chloroflexi bacterium AL-W]NOK90945.1 hypothetical protein [Chloroflexi bacterium AL-N15]
MHSADGQEEYLAEESEQTTETTTTQMNNDLTSKPLKTSPLDHVERHRRYAWDYFQLHSSQRIATFNFYITLSTAILVGIGTALQHNINLPEMAMVLGSLLSLISFIFWKLDQRNKMMIKGVEEALKEIEDHIMPREENEIPRISLFLRDDDATTRRRRIVQVFFWNGHFSYTNCFNWLFWTFGMLGAVGILLGVIRWFA